VLEKAVHWIEEEYHGIEVLDWAVELR